MLLERLQTLSWPERVALWLLYGTLIMPFLVWTQLRRRPGAPRAVAMLPLMCANLVIPFLFDGRTEILSSFLSAVATSMIANLKILDWILNRGSLLHPSLNLPQFIAVVALPITPAAVPPAESSSGVAQKGNGSGRAAEGEEGERGPEPEDTQAKGPRAKGRIHEVQSVRTMWARFIFKCFGLAATVWVLLNFSLSPIPLVIVQGFSMNMILTIFSDGIGPVVSTVLRLPIAPHFENIYAMTSASDFWNKRWNQIVSNVLRGCVYDPIVEGRLVHRPGVSARFSQARRVLAVLATFVASGLIHEGLYWYPMRRFTPHFLWFWHFTLWGAIIITENIGRRVLRKRGITVPTVVANPVSLILLHFMLYKYWFPPLNDFAIIERSAANIKETSRMLAKAALGG